MQAATRCTGLQLPEENQANEANLQMAASGKLSFFFGGEQVASYLLSAVKWDCARNVSLGPDVGHEKVLGLWPSGLVKRPFPFFSVARSDLRSQPGSDQPRRRWRPRLRPPLARGARPQAPAMTEGRRRRAVETIGKCDGTATAPGSRSISSAYVTRGPTPSPSSQAPACASGWPGSGRETWGSPGRGPHIGLPGASDHERPLIARTRTRA